MKSSPQALSAQVMQMTSAQMQRVLSSLNLEQKKKLARSYLHQLESSPSPVLKALSSLLSGL